MIGIQKITLFFISSVGLSIGKSIPMPGSMFSPFRQGILDSRRNGVMLRSFDQLIVFQFP